MTKNSFAGIWTALVTPFNSDLEIDWAHFEKLVNFQISAKVTGIVIAGTTGEASTLTIQEKLSLIRKAKVLAGSKCKVMAGTGSSNTQQTVELSRLAVEAGADALLVVTPPYNKPTYRGLYLHYQMIKEALPHTPICLYHVPSRTGLRVAPLQLAQLVKDLNIEMVKEASGEVNYSTTLTNNCNALILAGDDLLFLPSLAAGCQGLISVLSNALPKEYVELFKLWQSGEVNKATSFHQALLPLAEIMFIESNPGPVKALLAQLGYCQNFLRLPLVPVDDKNDTLIKAVHNQTLSTASNIR